MSHASDARALCKQLRREGFAVEMNSAGHWEVRWKGRKIATFPQTPSDKRWRQNCLGDIKRWKRAQGIGPKS